MRAPLLFGASLFVLMLDPAARAQDQLPSPQPAPASEVAANGEDDVPEGDGDDILVTGARERGSVPGDIQPELQLRSGDIRSFGVSSLTELLDELAPQLRTDRGRDGGRPVTLLNGRRVSGFGEVRDLPTEAIERIDILPEEAALRLGYRVDQRVVNIVLRRRFNAWTGETQVGGTTEGGRYTAAGDANLLRISRDRRLTVNVHADGATGLYEADRDILPVDTPTGGRPFSIEGNVTAPTPGAEVDPALSAIAGRPVTVAGVPVGTAGRPPLAAFLLPAWPADMGDYRTIAAPSRKLSANGTYSRPILGDVAASLNVSLESTASDSRLGLAGTSYALPAASPFSPFTRDVAINRYLVEAGPRIRNVDGSAGHVGLALNGDVSAWRWSFTSNYDRTLSRTLTDAGVDFAGIASRIAAGDPAIDPFRPVDAGLLGPFRQDFARSLTNRFDAEMVASGPVMSVPAGKLNASLKSGFESSDFDARAIRLDTQSVSDFGRRTGTVQASFDLPIASRRNGVLAGLGNLSLNANVAMNQVSDFGRLMTYGYGVNWTPLPAIRLVASVTEEDGAPTVSQLGDPLIVTPDARVFDYVRGESVDVTRIDGGNAALLSDNRRVMKLGLNVRPFDAQDLNLSANYLSTRTLNPISSIAVPTAAIEAALPERFVRDASGQLIRVDNRPLNFARRDASQLRWGVNFSKRLGSLPEGFGAGGGMRRRFDTEGRGRPDRDTPPAPPASDTTSENAVPPPDPAPAQDARPRERSGGFGPGGGFGGRGFGGRNAFSNIGRLNAAIYHTWHFEDSILVRSGVPVLDLLDGFATGSRGGQPRHEVDVQAGYTKGGLGMRLSGTWQSGTTVLGGTRANAPTDLDFASLTTVTLRLFANFQPGMTATRDHPWLRGTRVSLTVQNLFDAKPKVTDATGLTPLNYQPDLLDPTGRTLRLSIRKLFF